MKISETHMDRIVDDTGTIKADSIRTLIVKVLSNMAATTLPAGAGMSHMCSSSLTSIPEGLHPVPGPDDN